MRQRVLNIRNKMLHSLIKLVYLLGGALFSHSDVKQALTLHVSENRQHVDNRLNQVGDCLKSARVTRIMGESESRNRNTRCRI